MPTVGIRKGGRTLIASTTNKISYQGDGSTMVFPIPFDFIEAADIAVGIYNDNDNIVTILTDDYFVDVAAKTVTYPGYAAGVSKAEADIPPILVTGENLIIYRSIAVKQLRDFGEKYPLNEMEKALDKITMIIQDIQEALNRSIKISINDVAGEIDLQKLQEYAEQAISYSGVAQKQAQSALESAESALNTLNELNLILNDAIAETVKVVKEQADIAAEQAKQASMSASIAFGATAPAWDSTTAYNYPTVVAFTDGNTYRCIGTSVAGEYPNVSENWVRVTLDIEDFFDVDFEGGLMPALGCTYSGKFELDENRDIMPKGVTSI